MRFSSQCHLQDCVSESCRGLEYQSLQVQKCIRRLRKNLTGRDGRRRNSWEMRLPYCLIEWMRFRLVKEKASTSIPGRLDIHNLLLRERASLLLMEESTSIMIGIGIWFPQIFFGLLVSFLYQSSALISDTWLMSYTTGKVKKPKWGSTVENKPH